LSQWRTHGYRQWHAYRVILDESDTTSEHSEEIAATGIDCEKLRLSLTASYAEMLQRWIITPTDEMTYKLAVFKNITNAVLALHRAEIQEARVEIENRRLELLGEKQRNKAPSASASSSRASSSRETPSSEHAPIPPAERPIAPKPPRSENPAPPHEKPGPQNGAPPSPTPNSAPCAPSSQSAPRTQPTAPASPPTANSQPGVALVAQSHPSTRPGGPPRNATPRNPFGLL
jgi:hypothetical protein